LSQETEYKKDKTWSFWKVATHNFDDCVKKSWENFSINIPKKTNHLECKVIHTKVLIVVYSMKKLIIN
jgi:lycopene beta-cyclase